MAGPFTHWMIAEEALKLISSDPLGEILGGNQNFLLLGAASPDLPYLSIGSADWADRFHGVKTSSAAQDEKPTNAIPNAFLEYFNGKDGLDDDLIAPLFSWTMGYVSHMVADATIHPIVEAISGKLPEGKDKHTACEMTQDSLVFFQLKNQEITIAEYSESIESCRGGRGFFLLMETWRDFIQAIYKEVDTLHPRDWFSNYVNGMDVAEGGRIAALSSHYRSVEKWFYRSAREIISDHPQGYSKYFNEIKLPSGGRGHFMKDGFYPSVANVVTLWRQIFLAMQPNQDYRQWVKNWNLDTGVDQDSPSGVRTYWA